MRKVIITSFVAVGLMAGCTEQPNQISNNYMDDPKYNSEECNNIRLKALEYNDRVAGRAASGLALGLFLGPFGIPLAIAQDKSQDDERKAWAREIHRACSSDPLPAELLS